MKLVSFARGGEENLGFLVGDDIIDARWALNDATPDERAIFADAISFIRSGDEGRIIADRLIAGASPIARLSAQEVQLLAPLRPATILCSGSNYRDHNSEKPGAPTSGVEPEFFVKTADCVVGPGESIVHDPAFSEKLDCETELGVVIGKPGRHIPVSEALDHVFGYTIVNDVTARDRQVRKTANGTTWYDLGRGKAFDSSAPLGPCIVSADEIGDPQALQLRTRVNGEMRQSSSTTNMVWSCAELISFFSVNFTLRPGMVIITGTPAGTAWSVDVELGGKWKSAPGLVPATRYLLPGDVVECEIEKIGVLRNAVCCWPPSAMIMDEASDKSGHRNQL